MNRKWKYIIGAPLRIYALIDEDVDQYNPTSFDSGLVGYIERNKNGSWSCFYGVRFIGTEPNKKYAMELVGGDFACE